MNNIEAFFLTIVGSVIIIKLLHYYNVFDSDSIDDIE